MLDAELVRWRGGAGGRTAGAEPRGALRSARPVPRDHPCGRARAKAPCGSRDPDGSAHHVRHYSTAYGVGPPVALEAGRAVAALRRRAWRAQERRRPLPPRVALSGCRVAAVD